MPVRSGFARAQQPEVRRWLAHGLLVVIVLAAGCSSDSAEGDADAGPADTSVGGASETTERLIGHTAEIGADGTGRFRVEEIDGVWWFVTPGGNGLFSSGVNGVRVEGTETGDGQAPYHDAVLAKYGTEEAWAQATVEQLDELGFNTAGAWSSYDLIDEELPHTRMLDFGGNAPEIDAPALDDTPLGEFASPLRDYFDPAFVDGAATAAAEARPCVENPLCVGVFSDNEISWGPSPVQATTYLDAYLRLQPGAPGKLAVEEFLEDRYAGDIEALNATWQTDLGSFSAIQDVTTMRSDLTPGTTGGELSVDEMTTGDPADVLLTLIIEDGVLDRESADQRADRQAFRDHVVGQYHQVVTGALDDLDPGLLVFGPRFVTVFTAASVLETAAEYLDVIAINNYEFAEGVHSLVAANYGNEGYLFVGNPFDDLDTTYDITGRPLMITEWSYRAIVPDGPPSDFPPAYPTYETQAERASGFVRYMDELLSRPFVVGSHWFIYADQPKEGRSDGENNNFGIVDIDDELWDELAGVMRDVNLEIPDTRLGSG